jgi:hypothetical protein
LRAVGLITLAYRDKGGDLEAIKDGLIPAGLRLEGPSGAAGPGDTTIDGHAPTFGDKTVSVLAGAGKLINKVPPNVQEAASFGTSLLLGGPVAAVGGYFIGKAVEQGIKNSPDAQAAIREVGLQSVDLLSSSSPDRNREDAEDNGYAESSNLLTAAGTLLNIGTLKKLVSKAGGLIGGAEKAKPSVTVEEPDVPGSSPNSANGDSLGSRADAEAGTNAPFGNVVRGATSHNPFTSNSGITIAATPGVTTTVLGSFANDLDTIINGDLAYPKTLDFGPNPGGYNLLNVPDHLADTGSFFAVYNKPFLDAAIQRGEVIALATRPTEAFLNRVLPSGAVVRSGFGMEYDYLISKGYRFDSATSTLRIGR